MYLWLSLCSLYLLACQVSYCRQLRFLWLSLCDIFWELINSLVCWLSVEILKQNHWLQVFSFISLHVCEVQKIAWELSSSHSVLSVSVLIWTERLGMERTTVVYVPEVTMVSSSINLCKSLVAVLSNVTQTFTNILWLILFAYRLITLYLYAWH